MTCSNRVLLALPGAGLTGMLSEGKLHTDFAALATSETKQSCRPSETRHVNTSRASKAVNDSSTVDFVYFPNLREEPEDPYSLQPRMPIPPDAALSYGRSSASSSSAMKPEIHAVSEIASDTSASPMTEVVDNHVVDIDPFRLTETVGRSRDGEHHQRQNGARQSKQKGIIGELWSGMVEDLLGKGSEQARK